MAFFSFKKLLPIMKNYKSNLLFTEIRGFLNYFSNHFNSLHIKGEEKES